MNTVYDVNFLTVKISTIHDVLLLFHLHNSKKADTD
jgi:hypothetical protein